MDRPARGTTWRNMKLSENDMTYEVHGVSNAYVRGISRWRIGARRTHHTFTMKLAVWRDRVESGEIVKAH